MTEQELKALKERIAELEGKAQELVNGLDNADDKDAVKTDIKGIQDAIKPLIEQYERGVELAETEDQKAQIKELSAQVKELRDWNPGQHEPVGTGAETKSMEGSFYVAVKNANRGDQKAVEALGQKAMVQGTDSAGGYLVTPEILNRILRIRKEASPLRSLIPTVRINSDQLDIRTEAGGLTAGWVAELASKPTADMSFGSLTLNVFTAAGLAVVSNQLLRNAGAATRGPQESIDDLITSDLVYRLDRVVETAIVSGTGSGQPQGILGTAGVNAVTYTDGSPTAPELLDAVYDAISAILTNFYGAPSHIVMHPRTWAFIVKAREASSPSTYLIGSGSTAFGRRGNDSLPGGMAVPGGYAGELYGVPVILSSTIPTTLGGGTESRIIVGDFNQALIAVNQDVTIDSSEHVYFQTNQTIFRAEEALGFTAARYPKAFSVIGGTGLAGI